MCTKLIVTLSLALLVLMAGQFLLAYTKKEGLGKFTKFTSYFAIIFATLMFVGGLLGATLCLTCHKSKCHKVKTECNKGACRTTETKCHSGGVTVEKEVCRKEIKCIDDKQEK